MQQIKNSLGKLITAEPVVHRNLALFPLIDPEPAQAGYDTLDAALANGSVRITELDKSGSVPELSLRNNGDKPVLLLDGEELVGAKQNRVLNITLLVAAHSTMVIPVSCVEAGRWGFSGSRGHDFDTAGRTMYARGRAAKMEQVSESIRLRRSRRSDQSQVWENIAQQAAGFDVHSPTGAMSDIYDSQQKHLDDYMTAFRPQAGQTGAVFAIAGKIAGCELFDAATTWTGLAPKLIASYGLDALASHDTKAAPPSNVAAQAFLRQVANADSSTHDALGLGRDIRIGSPDLVGAALLLDDRIVHLSAFTQAGRDGVRDTRGPTRLRSRLVPFRRRRDNRER